MKILITADSMNQTGSQLTLQNDHLDNPNFLDIDIESDGQSPYTILVEDLYRAAKLFYEYKEDREKEQ